MKQWIIFCVACFVILKCTEEIDTTPPTVNITYPHNNQTFYLNDTIDIKVEATDNVEMIMVNFQISQEEHPGIFSEIINWDDYAKPYIYEKWIPPNPTKYRINATAYDNSNNSNYSIVIIEVSD